MALHCVGNYERNLYQDSDFISVFWDDEAKTLVHKEIGSTAYGGGAHSTPLTQNEAAWEEAREYRQRRMADALAAYHKAAADRLRTARKVLKENGVHTAFSKRLSVEDLEDIAALFSNRVRNRLKLNLRDQVAAWTPESKYPTPLSEKQMSYVRRPLKDKYGRATKRSHDIYKALGEYNRTVREFRGFGQK